MKNLQCLSLESSVSKKLSDSVPLGSRLYGAGPHPGHLELNQAESASIAPVATVRAKVESLFCNTTEMEATIRVLLFAVEAAWDIPGINIYYCMTGRAIQGNIQFEGGSIGPTAGRDNT